MLLAEALLVRISVDLGRPGLRLSPAAVEAMRGHRWPGNIRELANALERAAILAGGPELGPSLLRPPGPSRAAPVAPTMEEAERQAIQQALNLHGGNRRQAAEHLGIGLRTLYDKLRRYGIA